jgi:adenosylmethionine-8-amino-7-oxononanoate aminotransferase
MACAVAHASLALFDEEPVLARGQALATALREAWTDLAEHPAIRRARTLGPIAAAQIIDPQTGQPHPPALRFGWQLHRRALDHGLLVRPMGDCLYLMPPLATPPERVREAVKTLAALLS